MTEHFKWNAEYLLQFGIPNIHENCINYSEMFVEKLA